ncbi:hypothetical protein SO802_034597 [Lithocarpus litseifolius]|uniref:Ribosomal protein S3 n=1 Tax=Lithocarpus litseifolius TaxID=425828 RepID=A0AAW2BIY4_9ROSI
MKKSRIVSSNIPKLSLSLRTNPNIFLQEYSIASIQATDLNRSLCVYGERYGFGGVRVAISGSDGSQARVRLRNEGAIEARN